MPTPMKPYAVLKANGTVKHDPKKYEGRDTENDKPLGPPPDTLTPEQKAMWKEMEKNAIEGVLTSSDRLPMEMASVLMCKFRDNDITGTELGKLINCLSLMGMTPVDRQKVQVKKEKPSSGFSGL